MNAVADIAFGAVLGLSAVAAAIGVCRARASARDYVRFACALYVAVAAGDIVAATGAMTSGFLASAVTLLVCALAPVSLALGFAGVYAKPPSAALAGALLVAAAFAGIFSAATGAVSLAAAPLFASVCAMLALSLRAWRTRGAPIGHAVIAALSLLAGASAFLSGGAGGRTALALFSAASLLGASIALSRASGLLVMGDAEAGSAEPVFIGRKR